MLPILRNSFTRFCVSLPKLIVNQTPAFYHALSKPQLIYPSLTGNKLVDSSLLNPVTSQLVQSCGFKVKGHLRRRCKDCYFVTRQRRLYVICKTHPRHKQMSMIPDEKTTWIITHATMGKVRQW